MDAIQLPKPMRSRSMMAPWVRLVREPGLTPLDGASIRTPESVVNLIRPRLEAEEVEVFLLLCLDSQSKVRAVCEVTRGTLNSSLVHPREVFRLAVAMGAAGIIIAHNHPSGNPEPSADDQAITRQLKAAGEILGIELFDHVIVAGDRFVSFSTRGLL